MMRAASLCLVLLTALAPACAKKSDDGPSCAVVTDHMLAVTKQQLTGHGDMELGNRDAMIQQCTQRKLTAAQRRCLVAAKDLATLAGCTPPPARK